MRRRDLIGTIGLIGCATFVGVSFAAAPVGELDRPTDLRSDAVVAGRPRLVVVLFSLPDCPYCDAIRRQQLRPLVADHARAQDLIVREISITGGRTFLDFQGDRVTEAEFAKREAARFSPTVVFLGPAGDQVSEPLVGALLNDFYSAYLERAVRGGEAKIGVAAR